MAAHIMLHCACVFLYLQVVQDMELQFEQRLEAERPVSLACLTRIRWYTAVRHCVFLTVVSHVCGEQAADGRDVRRRAASGADALPHREPHPHAPVPTMQRGFPRFQRMFCAHLPPLQLRVLRVLPCGLRRRRTWKPLARLRLCRCPFISLGTVGSHNFRLRTLGRFYAVTNTHGG